MGVAFHNRMLRDDGKPSPEELHHQAHLEALSRQERIKQQFIDVLAQRFAERMNVSFAQARKHVLQVCVTNNRRRDDIDAYSLSS